MKASILLNYMTGALKMKGPSALVKRQEAKSVAIPIDTARAAYMLDSLTIRSNEEFYDIISAFSRIKRGD